MRRIVIDTNQLIKMAAAEERSPLFTAWGNQKFMVVMSIELLTEFESVTARPSIARFLPSGRRKRFVALLHERAIFTTLTLNAPRCRDPKDDMVIATAIAGQAEFIITADSDLLNDTFLHQSLAQYNLRVVWPLDFLIKLNGAF